MSYSLRRRTLLDRVPNIYLLDDEFRDTLAAGSVNGTPATPGPGVRVQGGDVVDSIGSGVYNWTYWATNKNYLGFASPLSIVPGRIFIVSIKPLNAGEQFYFGLDPAAVPPFIGSTGVGGVQIRCQGQGAAVRFIVNNANNVNLNTIWPNNANPQKLAVVCGNGRAYLFRKWDTDTLWTFVCVWTGTIGTSLYPYWSNFTATSVDSQGNIDFLRIPAALWLPTPLAYDTFTRANGALGSTETVGPDGQACTPRLWTGATWTISGNKAVNTPTVGAELITNGGFSAWTGDNPNNWILNVAEDASNYVTQNPAGKCQIISDNTVATGIYQNIGVLGIWYQFSVDVDTVVSGSLRVQSVDAASIFQLLSSTGAKVSVRRAKGVAVVIVRNAACDVTIDNASLKALVLSELFSSITPTHADVMIDANVTWIDGLQAGLVCRLDDAANPQNFLLAYLQTAGNVPTQVQVYLDKCVAGVYTNLIAANVTYVADATLRAILNGSSVSIYYNNAQVGTTQTVGDAGILNNTLHGKFSTSNLNSLDVFQVLPVGTGGEYAALDKWSGVNP